MKIELNGFGGYTYTLTIQGHVPSKKNRWRRRANGGIGLDRQAQGDINALVTQAKLAWGRLKPLEHPDMDVKFYVRDFRGDRDNKLSCVLDVLQEAGVIVSDNTKRFNGTLCLMPAEASSRERVELTITTRGTQR